MISTSRLKFAGEGSGRCPSGPGCPPTVQPPRSEGAGGNARAIVTQCETRSGYRAIICSAIPPPIELPTKAAVPIPWRPSTGPSP